ncbi:hypothetical protein [Limnoglobus roseus]|uniref:SMI1/KNR4 family protein n=1 Tax=Limnoglobus roseus TaxID=2598579 RepID=A0A5C1AUF8_9BACT|nr:hypothetical protein [Limnoglobus roseus]QEL20874.1 hypothetical protein PX52LOC_07995 [Limnoglobus roseus]
MTEAEWLAFVDPYRALESLAESDLLTDRKQRLIDCACVRRVPNLFDIDCCARAVLAAERFADDLIGLDELRDVQAEVLQEKDAQVSLNVQRYLATDYKPDNRLNGLLPPDAPQIPNLYSLLAAAGGVAWEYRGGTDPLRHAAEAIAWRTIDQGSVSAGITAKGRFHAERVEQVRLIHDVIGNPFRPVAFDPAWLTTTAVGLAESIYADRAFDRLPILADALQDAGCEDGAILGHCRGDRVHARGCWVVDGVLGKG